MVLFWWAKLFLRLIPFIYLLILRYRRLNFSVHSTHHSFICLSKTCSKTVYICHTVYNTIQWLKMLLSSLCGGIVFNQQEQG